MDIKKITEIINSNLSDDYKNNLILSVISKDEKAIPSILMLLNDEREQNKEFILDQNAELSRALIVLKNENIADPKWVVLQIIKHYEKWKDKIKCNFKVDGLI